jgi:XRE family transcriptional regulator, aerobic/anaerobic benzoate catabolism transcriptional regulator
MRSNSEATPDQRRGGAPAAEAYLKRVGERVRLARARRGMSRKILSRASGVSERYLAELERGAGNASLLVLRQIADALSIEAAALVSDQPERPLDLTLAIHQLERLSAAELAEARHMIGQRFGIPDTTAQGRIALIGLRGAGKTTLGQLAAEALGVPFVELDREIERASGMELSEIFATRGQAMFRRLERQCLETIVGRYDRVVIATGGSLVTEPATYDLLLSTCFVVWLSATPDQHMSRVIAQGDLRPMADGPQAMDDLKAILDSRTPLYAKADAEVNTSDTTTAQAFASLLGVVALGRARVAQSPLKGSPKAPIDTIIDSTGPRYDESA